MSERPTNPYANLPETAFWKSAVAACNPLEISGLWRPKFPVPRRHKVITAGSCFAQHFSRALVARGHNWLDAEPAPKLLSEDQARDYNYGIFSFRTGNIYTARMLRQWLGYAFGEAEAPEEIWKNEGRVMDPLRPAIEPGGFASEAELLASRDAVLAAIRNAITQADIFVFTMGLTESWRNRETGLEYALCPGTVGGQFDKDQHVFVNQGFSTIRRDMRACLEILRAANPGLRVLLTVSPVPLTATATDKHVLTATSYSKSVLRAVAGELADDHDDVDYFPSYEIITHPAYRGMFYAPNQRSVVPQGVNHVMESFFACQHAAFPRLARQAAKSGAKRQGGSASSRAVKCEEEFLDAFG
ncbi:hypothetical protein RSK20926_11919 [Roseobacter sp. SK209-2-6]|uniref:GSCFA domain-containing protein n=1 Tax=Roseobacter sp. SK209-2-6 TaxID=388739 RepID=UPI0000F3C51D|nr:GSCFA domain-containing protein [Roseobacter sp. SK209-2-6]EBA18425.1 hypothetical protein RSK20926_11919 [Roseobacter sp. SK209-2-6]